MQRRASLSGTCLIWRIDTGANWFVLDHYSYLHDPAPQRKSVIATTKLNQNFFRSENVHFKDNNVVVILRDLIQPHWEKLQETQQMGTSVSTPTRGPTSTLSLTQFLQKFLICLGSGYREIGPFQPMHVDRGLLNCPTSPSHEKQTKSDQAKISLCQSSD